MMSERYILTRLAVIGVVSLVWTHSIQALSLILPMEAIYESARLTHEAFKEKYPGIDVSSDIPDEEGYYVRYNHENLTYYFGPVDDYLTAEQKSFELQEIVDLATFELPYLKSSEVYVWQFSNGMFQDALSGGQQEGLQVAEIGGDAGSSGSSENSEGGTIVNAGPMSAAQMAQMRGAEESGEMGQRVSFPGQQGQMSGQQQAQQVDGQMSQNQRNPFSNQSSNTSQSQQSQKSSGSGGQGGGQGSGGGSSGSSKSQGQQQQQGGGMSIWQMLGKMLFGR